MSLFTAAAVAAHRKFPRVPFPPALDAGQVQAFERLRITVPPGLGTPQRILSQGAHGNAYVRRSGKKATDVGKIDYYARGTNTAGAKDSFVVQTDVRTLTVQVEVTDPIPNNGGGVFHLNAEAAGGGNGSQGSPWNSWATAVTSAPANSTVVVAARRADGRNQVYPVTTVGGNGPALANNNVTFMADPAHVAAGNRAMIWSHGDVARRFYDELNQGHWTQISTSPNVWRSTVNNLPNCHSTTGMYRTRDGRWVKLVFYGNNQQLYRQGSHTNAPAAYTGCVAQLQSTTHTYAGHNTTNYIGPGIAGDGGALYVRLEETPTQQMGPKDPRQYGWSWIDYLPCRYATPEGDPVNPGTHELNPNHVPIVLGFTHPERGASNLISASGKTGAVFRNLDFIGGGWAIRWTGGANPGPKFYGCRFLATANTYLNAMGYDNADHWSYTFSVEGGTYAAMLFDRCEFWGGMPPWISYHGGKGMVGLPEMSMRNTPFGLGNGSSTALARNSSTIRNCRFEGFFALCQGDGDPGWAFITHHTLFRDMVSDCGIVSRQSDAPIYWIRNIAWAAGMYSYTSNTDFGSNWTDIGKIYEAFNLSVNVRPAMFRSAYANSGNNGGVGPWPLELGHGWTSEHYGHPKKRYYCTHVTSNGSYAKPATQGVRGMGCQIEPLFDAQTRGDLHATYNNIYMCFAGPTTFGGNVGTKWASDSTVGYYVKAGYLGRAVQATHDGNWLWRDPATPNESGGGITHINAVTAVLTNGADLAVNDIGTLRGHGFEANGGIGDPQLAGPLSWPGVYDLAAYRPKTTAAGDGVNSPCASGAVNITGLSWGSPVAGGGPVDFDGNDMVPLLHRPHRGCYDPEISPLEQEIGPL